jgi:ABC-2 type transport system permease protein
MHDAAVAARQVRYEQLSFWRNPAAAVFAFAFPIVFLVVFGTLNNGITIHVEGQRVSYDDYYIPALITYGIIGASFTNLSVQLSIRRDSGVLKRLRGTPLPSWAFMAGVIGSSLIVCLLLTIFTTLFGMLAYHVQAPHHILALLVTLLLGAAVFCALGLALAAFIPNGDAAPAISNIVILPLVFISGTFFPIDQSSLLAKVAAYFPVRHFIAATYAAFDPTRTAGSGFAGSNLLILAVWGLGAILVAIRRFQWEPRRS